MKNHRIDNRLLKITLSSVLLVVGMVGSGYATEVKNPNPDASSFQAAPASDPLEKLNRKVYTFNRAADKLVLRPVAKAYNRCVPDVARKSVGRFFTNLDQLGNITNDALQADAPWLLTDIWRFTVNSTIGVGGLFDPASKLGLPRHSQDFGITLARWGYKDSSYLMLPLLGPRTVRDTAGIPVNVMTSPSTYTKPTTDGLILKGVEVVDTRSRLLNADRLIDQAFDPYVFVRDAYLQKRASMVARLEAQESSPDLQR